MIKFRSDSIRLNSIIRFYSQSPSTEWTSNKVRKQFLDYFKERDHEFVKSIPLLRNDRNPLLVNAGMNQFKYIFLADEQHLNLNPQLKNLSKVVNYQKCVRLSGKHNDFNQVGRDFTHHTFFEMLGNWSFNNNYFKEDACKYALDLLVNYYGIDQNRLVITYFGGDQTLNLSEDVETKEIWLNLGFPEHRVIPMSGLKENFWEMAIYGPCGVCTEIHFVRNDDLIKQNGITGLELLSNSVEVWNLVFIQYERTEEGLMNLKSRHVDTGMGLERLLAILNGKESNFDTDLFLPLIDFIQTRLKAPKYTNSLTEPLDIGYRIVVDHIRAICMLISDNVLPAHSNQGLIVRRLIRRMHDILRNEFKDKRPKDTFRLLIDLVVELLKDAYPELLQNKDTIKNYVFKEYRWQFKSTQYTKEFFEQLKDTSQMRLLDGKNAAKLLKKGGLTKDGLNRIAEEQGFKVDWPAHDEIINEEIRKSNVIKEQKRLAKSGIKSDT